MPFKLVIFDFDGTLADSGAWFVGILNELAEELKFKRLEPADYEKVRRMEVGAVLKHLKVPIWKLPRIMQRIRQFATRDAGKINLFPGIEEMLTRLNERGVTLAVVTSNAEEPVRRVLGPKAAGLIAHFRCGAALFGKDAKLKALLRQAKVGRKEAIYVGDEIRDGVAARKAGMAFGAVAWGYTDAGALATQRPEFVFNTVGELIEKVSERSVIALVKD